MKGQVRLVLFCILLSAYSATAQDKLYRNTFSSADVALLDGPFKHARDLNIQVLLQYDVDRLLAGYRKEAGLPEKALSYPNWDGLDGHVGGHYLSALAMHYASTKNEECKKRMDYVLSELKACQESNTLKQNEWLNGYVGAVPNSKTIWSSLNKGDFSSYRAAWVPWYNLHKTYAGLRDAWLYAGDEGARKMFLKFCDWAVDITATLTEDQMQSMLDVEHGGMNEIFADAYQMTNEERYLSTAKRFSHRMLLEAMASRKDNLDNKHANTQVPKAIGFHRIGSLTNDQQYLAAGKFFWEAVTTNRTLAFGGNSRREFFPAVPACNDFVNEVEGPESCNSYNMLKLSESLFNVEPSVRYIDYYERALYNHILSTQHPEHGGYVYFTTARPRHYRVYSSPNNAMWCCVGSGMENHGKYNQFIYSHKGDSLYWNLFIPSELNWRGKKIKLRQETSFPDEEKMKLIVVEGSANFTLMVRYPSWVTDGAMKISVNNKDVKYTVHPGSYVTITRKWKKGDVVALTLPMHNTIEQLPNVPEYMAIVHGPIVLAAKTGTEDLKGLIADDGRWAHIASGERLPVDKASIIVEDDLNKITTGLVPVKGKSLTFTFPDLNIINPAPIVLEPFFRIHDARYMLYWMTLSKTLYKNYLDSVALSEKEKLAIQKRTLDFVTPGEQQPEVDHELQLANSKTGNRQNEFWRDASDEGYFSYNLSTNKKTGLSLIVRYWGAEWGNRKFNIYIDGEKLITEDNTNRWSQSKFFDLVYPIPDLFVKGKEIIRVKFQALPKNTAGGIYSVILLRSEETP